MVIIIMFLTFDGVFFLLLAPLSPRTVCLPFDEQEQSKSPKWGEEKLIFKLRDLKGTIHFFLEHLKNKSLSLRDFTFFLLLLCFINFGVVFRAWSGFS